MNEEPKARQSINLDELERQLREASRNQAFRKTVSEQNIDPTIDNPAFFDEERGSNADGSFQTGTNWPEGTLSSKDGIGSRVQASAEEREPDSEFRGPPPFLTGSRDDRFPDVGSNADPVTRSRSLRSIFLIAFFCVLIVAAGYGYLHIERDVGASSNSENVPIIKPDPSPARVKAEVAAESEKPAVGQELFSPKNGAVDTQAVVVSSKEQPVDLNAKKLSAELQSGGVQGQDGTAAVGQVVGTGGAAESLSETKDLTLPNSGVKSVRTVKVRADGTIIDPTGMLKSTPKEPSSESTAASQNTSELVASVPKVETNQNSVVSVEGVAEASQGQAVSLSTIPFPPVRPLNLGSETSEGDPIEAVSGLLANAQDAPATNPSGVSEAQNQASLTAGLYSVQFGAPATESEARALIERVRARMGESLASTEIGIFRGENSGKTVFRVRVVNIAKADGQSLCQRYVSLGGQCFVTRN